MKPNQPTKYSALFTFQIIYIQGETLTTTNKNLFRKLNHVKKTTFKHTIYLDQILVT